MNWREYCQRLLLVVIKMLASHRCSTKSCTLFTREDFPSSKRRDLYTTVQFVKGHEKQLKAVCNGEGGDTATWLDECLKDYQKSEAELNGGQGGFFQFFQYEILIEIKHPEIEVDYALIDMPGLRNADPFSSCIEGKLADLVKECDLFLSAEDDPDILTVLRPRIFVY